MEGYSEKWLKGASEDLDAARLLFQNNKHRQAVFYLQQTCEKTVKGLFMRIGILPEDKESEELKEMRSFIGLISSNPIDFKHELRSKLLDDMERMLKNMSPIIDRMSTLPDKELASKMKTFLNTQDMKDKIGKAREIKFIPAPTIEELDGSIKACNSILELSTKAENEAVEAAKKTKIPDKDTLVAQFKDYGELSSEGSAMIDKLLEKPAESFISKRIIYSFTLVTLLILNTYLLPHEKMARYPDSISVIEYNENIPIVQRFNEISSVLKRCLTLVSS